MNTDSTEPLQMMPVSAYDAANRQIPCLPMPFGSWQGEGDDKTFIPDPQVYFHNGHLFAHPYTMQKHGLSDKP